MADMQGRLRLCVLGSSGSVGTQTLDVIRAHPDKLCVTALSVQSSAEKLVEQVREFGASHAVVSDANAGSHPVLSNLPASCELGVGPQALAELVALDDVDCVVVAVVGSAGIRATYEALRAGKRVAFANKETLVCAGDLLMPLAAPGQILPVDSEHAAIFQCMEGRRPQDVRRIWLTCSGGPFFGRDLASLADVTPAEALAHPNWSMGPKITVDSATLMNKGLEVIEAHHLFGVDIDTVQVLIHRQSKIHSMVEFADHSVMAQLAAPDMRGPIQFALSWPERWDCPMEAMDFYEQGPLTFDKPDLESFRCLALAYEAGRTGGTMPCVLNAANEVLNAAFRQGACGFVDIATYVERVMDAARVARVESLEQLDEVDAWARTEARSYLKG